MSTPFQLYYIMERNSVDSGAATNNLNHVDVESHIPKSVLWVAVRAYSIATLRTVRDQKGVKDILADVRICDNDQGLDSLPISSLTPLYYSLYGT